MTVFASAVASQNDHGYEAGRYVAGQVLAAFQRPPALLVAFISDGYNSTEEVVRGIRSINNTVPLIGSSARIVMTMGDIIPRGVSLLALSSDDVHFGVALQTGLQQQPEAAAERAIEAAASSLSAPLASEHTSLLALTSDGAGDAAIGKALHTACTRMPEHCAIAGAAVQQSGSSSVFVNDDVAADALAVGVLHTTAPVGIGIHQGMEGDLPDAAQIAAQQALAALNNATPAAAIVIISGEPPTNTAIALELTRVREVLGRVTPLIGAYHTSAIAPDIHGAPALHQQAVLVYTIGQQ